MPEFVDIEEIKVKPWEEVWDSLSTSPESKMFGMKEPLLPYTPFKAEEALKDIKNRQDLAEFKKDLIHQKEGIAQTIEELRKIIEANPGVTKEFLLSRVQGPAQEYRFNRRQLFYFKLGIEGYLEKHLAVEKYRTEYPDDTNLFEACFGRKPEGKIEVVKGPMTFYFRCFNPDDYAFIYNHFSETKDKARAYQATGAAIPKAEREELWGTITAENVTRESSFPSEEVRIHEEQHQFNKLFQRDKIRPRHDELLEKSEDSEKAAMRFAHELVRVVRGVMMDSRAKDEILAYYKTGTAVNKIYEKLTELENYDYLKENEESIRSGLLGSIKMTVTAVSGQAIDLSELKSYIEMVFGEGYKTDLKRWTDSISKLEQKGYTRDRIISLLYQEPVNSWPNLARRI